MVSASPLNRGEERTAREENTPLSLDVDGGGGGTLSETYSNDEI